jgi:hypothetical protein
MQHQRIPDEDQQRRHPDEQIDKIVLSYIVSTEAWPWSLDEIARELGDKADAIDSVHRLVDTGLLHRIGDFVFPTRPARRAAEIEIGMVWSQLLNQRAPRCLRQPGAGRRKDRPSDAWWIQAGSDRPWFGGCLVNPYTESLDVLQVLGQQRGRPLKRLYADLDDLPAEWIEESIESLTKVVVVIVKQTRLHMSPALMRLDELDMVSI